MANYQWQNPAGQQVTSSTYSYMSQVIAAWGQEWGKREITYEWSNGRRFEDSRQGPYNVVGE